MADLERPGPKHRNGASPATNPDDHRYQWPRAGTAADRFRWPRRFAFVAVLVAAAAFVVYAFGRAPNNEVTAGLDPAIVRQVPTAGSHVLHQAEVGAILRQGYDGRLTINGVPIPESQMDGAIPPTSPVYDPALGPRPNNKNEVLFTPGKGKAVDHYETGDVTIVLTYWLTNEGPARSKTASWKISVT
ncbi:MAG: hypothetical protein ABI276_00155 [Acidimicrobiales bacterium]